MANVSVDNFMGVLAAYMAAAAGVEHAGTPRALWLYKAVEGPGVCAATWSVLAPYAGAIGYVPVLVSSIQCKTIGEDQAAIAQAQALYASLLDANGRPLRRKDLAGHRVLGVMELQAPAVIGRDEKKRAEVVFNFDAQVVAIP
ncbi:MAG: hypothetical protein WBD40_03570 [Tepidisphaeraceae bacterium]